MYKLSQKKPILFCAIAMVAFIIVLTVVCSLASTSDKLTNTYLANSIWEAACVICGIVFMIFAKQGYVLNCGFRNFGKSMLPGMFFIVMGLYSFLYLGALCLCWDKLGDLANQLAAMGIDFTGYTLQSGLYIVTFVIYMLLVGLAEEFMFRGVIAEKLLKYYGKDEKGVKKAVIVSGIFFGVLHLSNGFATGLVACIVQAIITAFMGMAFTMIYYKNKNIYAVALLHAFLDFGSLAWQGGIFAAPTAATDVSAAMDYSLTNLYAAIPYAIVTLVLMRKKNIEIILTGLGISKPNQNEVQEEKPSDLEE